jgi:type II secretory pathway predicted ATPase ExeA
MAPSSGQRSTTIPTGSAGEAAPDAAAPGGQALADAGAGYLLSLPHHQFVVATIRSHLNKQRGFVLLSGDPRPSGEMVAQLLNDQSNTGSRATLIQCSDGVAWGDLLRTLGQQLGLNTDASTDLTWAVLTLLMQETRKGICRVLILENADALDAATLESLGDFAKLDDPFRLPVVLLASSEFAAQLEAERSGLKRRLVGSVALRQLAQDEVGTFIDFEFGRHPDFDRALFDPTTIKEIADAGRGDPEQIKELAWQVLSQARQRAAAPLPEPTVTTRGAGAPPAAPRAPTPPPDPLAPLRESARARIARTSGSSRSAEDKAEGAKAPRLTPRRVGLAYVLMAAVTGLGVLFFYRPDLVSPQAVRSLVTRIMPPLAKQQPRDASRSQDEPRPSDLAEVASVQRQDTAVPPQPAIAPAARIDMRVAEARPSPPLPPAPAPQQSVVSRDPPPTTAPPAAAAYRLQLGSVRSAEAARQVWDRLQSRHRDLLGRLSLSLQRANLGERGIFYRIQAGPLADAALADRTCAELRHRGDDCLIVSPDLAH